MGLLILQIAENVLILYFTLYLVLDVLFFGIFIVDFLRNVSRKKRVSPAKMDLKPIEGVSILVPAFNEETTIGNCIQMLRQLDYPVYEVIVINDGSTDETLNRVLSLGNFKPIPFPGDHAIDVRPVQKVYELQTNGCTIRVIDKQNGGKADALNAGLRLARFPYVCTIDADSILDRRALWEVVAPFQEDPEVVITGGELAVLNDTRIVNGELQTARFPHNPLVVFQIVEYIKSFMISRTGLGKLRGLLIMSGAFTVFRKNVLLAAGGFLSPYNRHPVIRKYFGKPGYTVCEDLEVVVRVKRYARDAGLPERTVFLPHPVCWTEVPEKISQLSRQRERWHRGLGEALFYHKAILFDPHYGSLGLFALPYYLFFEWLSPIAKLSALTFLLIMLMVNMLHGLWLLMLLLTITFGAALLMGVTTVIVEFWSSRHSPVNRQALRYKGMRDWLRLLGYSILSDFSYAFLRVFWQLNGVRNFFRGYRSWNKFARQGVENVVAEEKVQ